MVSAARMFGTDPAASTIPAIDVVRMGFPRRAGVSGLTCTITRRGANDLALRAQSLACGPPLLARERRLEGHEVRVEMAQ